MPIVESPALGRVQSALYAFAVAIYLLRSALEAPVSFMGVITGQAWLLQKKRKQRTKSYP